MTDEFSGGGSSAPSEAPASSPSESPSSFGHPVDVESDPVVTQNRHAVLGDLAKSENIEGYAQERRDEEDVIFRGKDIPEERKRQWYRRASKALQNAANEAAGIQPSGQQPQQQQPSQSYEGQQYPDPSQDLDYMRKMGAAAERINQYYGQDQARRQNVIDWGQAMDPDSLVSQWLIDNESVVAPQILERLAAHPEGWRELAELPPQTRHRWLSKFEGHIEAQMGFQQKMAQQMQQWDQAAARRTSNAPPPIPRLPAGGAMPPRDAHALARSEDVSSYIALRKSQDKRARE